jgi:hypothetical protein
VRRRYRGVVSTAGWYPDPGGAPGRYRYWDGTGWSVQLTDDPRQPAPGPASTTRRRSRLALPISLLSGVVILLVVGALIAGNLRPTVPEPLPIPTVSGGNDTSPTATPRSSATPVPCPIGNPDDRADHPNDERVYGGNLSFAAEPAFEHAAFEPRLSFAYDVVQQTFQVSDRPPWIAQLAVGLLRARDGFVHDPRNTVDSVVQCTMLSDIYNPYRPSRRDLRSSSVIIDRHEGWLIESEIRVDQPGLPFPGDRVVVVVVRDHNDWGLFFGAAPIGNAIVNDMLDHAVSSLRAS